jgi:small subunit ribosomal protein S16
LAVRIRLKKFGKKHRPFFRLCAMDARAPRDGRIIEELGTYDPMVPETDARAILKGERIDYWLGVGALPTPKAGVLIRKYGSGGSHLDAQREALDRLGGRRGQAIEAARRAAKTAAEEAARAAAAEAAARAKAEAEAAAAPAADETEAAADEAVAVQGEGGEAAGDETTAEA